MSGYQLAGAGFKNVTGLLNQTQLQLYSAVAVIPAITNTFILPLNIFISVRGSNFADAGMVGNSFTIGSVQYSDAFTVGFDRNSFPLQILYYPTISVANSIKENYPLTLRFGTPIIAGADPDITLWYSVYYSTHIRK